MLLVSNLVRCLALTALTLLHLISLRNAAIVFIAGDVLELIINVVIFSRSTKVPFRLMWHRQKYAALLREALPQTGVNLLTSAMARFDWVFIGLMASAVKLAEYSFAYKVFEMSTLPLLAIAPLLIPRFTKMFKHDAVDTTSLTTLFRAEMVVAAFTGLVLNVLWSPLIDLVTAGKYGAVNSLHAFYPHPLHPFPIPQQFFVDHLFRQRRNEDDSQRLRYHFHGKCRVGYGADTAFWQPGRGIRLFGLVHRTGGILYQSKPN
jgi:O-antigen/teichoic acid export membrane protein